METALYYTFSTIAQVLGCALTLIAAIVLFRLQSINERISKVQYNAVVNYLPNPDLEKHIQDDNHKLISEYIQKTTLAESAQYNFEERKNFLILVEKKMRLNRLVMLSFKLTVISITFSVALIPIIPFIMKYKWMVVTAPLIEGLLFLLCVFNYQRLLFKISEYI